MIAELLSQFEPESEGLLREISAHTSDRMLQTIAEADYGQDIDKHLAALLQVRDAGVFPKDMHWFPGEVLELFRHSEPGRGDLEKGEDDEFVYWARAFCCAALLRATHDPWNYGDGIDTEKTTIQLIHSLRALPADMTPQAVRFFAWLLLHSNPEGRDAQVCAYGLALLWFSLQLTPLIADKTLTLLTKWIIRRAKQLYANLIFESDSLPLRMGLGNPPPSRWDSLGAAFFDLDLCARAPELKELIQQIGLELAG
jgi:hypothetical protein